MTLRIEDQVSVQAASAAGHAVNKGQMDTGVADAKNRANHTGTQLAATISDLATQVDARIQTVLDIASTPATLDTLNELAAALGDDPNFAATLAGQISGLDGRLDTLEAAPSSTRSVSFLKGDAAASSFACAHNWALADKNKVTCEVVDTLTSETVIAKVVRTDVNTVTVSFGSHVPAANQYRILLREIIG